MTIAVHSFLEGRWTPPDSAARPIASAVTGDIVAKAGHSQIDAAAILQYAHTKGGPALRAMGFHDRAKMLKALATYLTQHKEQLYELSYHSGTTRADAAIDIEGGIGTMFVIASKGRREMPDGQVYIDGDLEGLSRDGSFLGRHICTPLQGAALHINAFNFPVWGMLEKLAPALLAGVPAIVKPATATSYVTEACVRMIVDSAILPDGAIQMIGGGVGDMLDHLGAQDVVSFTGSADTAFQLRGHAGLMRNSVRFMAEQDSLNATVLGPDAAPGSDAFDVFIKEVTREMTAKAGQKCTAIRRILVPEPHIEATIAAISTRLARTTIGDPRLETTRMGALVSRDQRDDVLAKAARIATEATRVFGDPDAFDCASADAAMGAFVPPLLFHCPDPDRARIVHEVEAFGPVSTVMAYRDASHASMLANKGGGSLVASVITSDTGFARDMALGAAAWHGRLYFTGPSTAKSATGHGAPMPHMVHGGPGRAGGGEELGGVRGVLHYMQRTAIQGSPDILSAIGGDWLPGGSARRHDTHPFRRTFTELQPGDTITTADRVVTLEDIEHFAHFTGDTFYAHMDEDAARRNPFFPGRVAHGYLLLSFAAGLFVDPDEGPVLANTGLDNLRFMKPVAAGARIHVVLTVKRKTRRTPDYGEVRWHVSLRDQDDDLVAEYELLTMVAI